MRISQVLVPVLLLCITSADDSVTKIMKENIEHISRFLKKELVHDVKNNNKYISQSMNLTLKTANEILDYVDKSMAETADKVQNTFEIFSNKLTNNFKEIQEKNSNNLKALQTLFTDNEGSIVDGFTSKLNDVVTKMETRLKQHEDFMTTSVAVCAQAYSHMSRGTVKYSSVFLNNVFIKGESVPGVLNPKSGDFIVPPGGVGIYHISFGVLIDTVSPRDGISRARQPPRFAVKSSHGHKITLHKQSQVTATVGVENQVKDLVPASRSLILSLQAGDIVSLEQMNNHAEQSYRITFCVHQVHSTLESSVIWKELPKPKAPVLNMTTTYVEPIIAEVKIEDLKSTQTKPEVLLPVMTALQSPTSQFVAGQTNTQANPLDQEDPYGLIWDDTEEHEAALGFE